VEIRAEQLQEGKKQAGPAPARMNSRKPLKSFGEFFGERARRTLRTTLLRTFVLLAAAFTAGRSCGGSIYLAGWSWGRSRSFRSWGLGLIGPKQAIFQRRAVKTPDDRIHFFRVGRVDEGESLGLLSLWVADHLDIVVDEVFCVKPGLDVVLSNPDRQVSEENCKAHSGVSLTPLLGIWRNCFADAIHES
jgi:hypothetical protein